MSDSQKKEVKPLGSLDALGSLLAPGSAAQEEKRRQRIEQEKKERARAAAATVREQRAAERKAAVQAEKEAIPKLATTKKRAKSTSDVSTPKIKRQVYLSPKTFDWVEKTHFSTRREWRKSDGRGEITESLFIEACIQIAIENETGKPGKIIKMLQALKES